MFPFSNSVPMIFLLQSLSDFLKVSLMIFIKNNLSLKPYLMTFKSFRVGRYGENYLKFLLYSLRKSSRAIVIEGALGFGALISSLSPSFSTAQAVVGPNAAILISP